MFFSELKTFHDAIKPLVYFNCIIGMGAFRLPHQSNCTYIFMIVWTIFATLFNWVTIYVTLNALAGVVTLGSSSPMALRMFKILVQANSSITVIAPLLTWFQKNGLVDCMRRMVNLDNIFRAVLGAPKEYRKRFIRLTCHTATIWSVIISVTVCDLVFGQRIEQQLGMRSVWMYFCVSQTLLEPIAVMLVMDLNFCTCVGYLGQKFQALNDSLLALTRKSPTSYPGKRLFTMSQNAVKMIPGNNLTNPEAGSLMNDRHYLLREIRKAHLELCKLSQTINRLFGVQNLISTGVSFVMITGLLYTIYSAFTWEDSNNSKLKESIPSVIWTFLYVFKIWMVNHACWSVSNEAGRTGTVMYELLNSKVDKELQKEIQEFGVQMLQDPVRFNACGFFTLDYTFVQGVIGSITTYLIILIQMSHISESPTSDSAIPWNGTEISIN